MEKFKIVTTGEILIGEKRKGIEALLCEYLNMTPTHLNVFFNNNETPVFSNLDLITVKKRNQELHNIGLLINIKLQLNRDRLNLGLNKKTINLFSSSIKIN